jgi:small subunit ribosomal protein S16
VVKLRLRRMGAKKRPSYRIVAAESSSPRDGRFIEAIGFYDPLTNPATITLKEDRVKHWLSVGAQPTETVRDIFVRHGLMEKPAAKGQTATESVAPA